MPIRQTLSPHISTMHFLQKLFQELVHCDRTWRKKKGGGGRDRGRRFTIKMSRSCLQWENLIGNQEYQGNLFQCFINT